MVGGEEIQEGGAIFLHISDSHCCTTKGNKTMQTIFIPQNPQYGIIVEDPKRISNSIYYEVYRNASRSVRDIIESNNRDVKSYPQERFINTTVSFTGERGTGKSPFHCVYQQFQTVRSLFRPVCGYVRQQHNFVFFN